jgi:hypothetical protein
MYSRPTPFRTAALVVLLAAAGQSYLLKVLAPEVILDERASVTIFYLFVPNFLAYLCFRWFVYPRVLSPYRYLPGPKVRVSLSSNVASSDHGGRTT